jgi:hypothetical protein
MLVGCERFGTRCFVRMADWSVAMKDKLQFGFCIALALVLSTATWLLGFANSF